MDIKQLLKLGMVSLIAFQLSACIPTKEERLAQNKSIARASDDPALSHALLAFAKNHKKYKAELHKQLVTIGIYNNLYENQISSAINSYQQKDSTKDAVAKTYIVTAKKRGHRVAMYNAAINKMILSIFNQGRPLRGEVYQYALDNALIEYDKNSRMVSVLVRLNSFMIPIGNVLHEQNSRFYLSGLARMIESKISRKTLQDNFIADL